MKKEESQTALMTVQNGLPVATMQDATTLAQSFAQAHVLGAQNAAEGMLALAIIREVGIIRATSKYQIMMGQLSKKAHAILGDFVAAGGKYKIVRRDSECAEAVVTFGETKDMVFKFTWEDAQEEPFVYEGGPNKQFDELRKPKGTRNIKAKYRTPRSRMQMLWARVASDIGNSLCPDCGEGMYPPEMVEDFNAAKPVHAISIDDARARQVGVAGVPPASINLQATEPDLTDAVIVDDSGAFELCPVQGMCFGHRWDEINDDGLREMWDSSEVTDSHRAVIAKIVEARKAVQV